MQPDDRPEDLYQRIVTCIEDNPLTADGGITRHGQTITSDEDITPLLKTPCSSVQATTNPYRSPRANPATTWCITTWCLDEAGYYSSTSIPAG